MAYYFNINYQFDRDEIQREISEYVAHDGSAYICVADGVIMNTVNRVPEYKKVVDGAIFSLCDSNWVPLYIKLIHGDRVAQYCGSDLFRDMVSSRRYRMYFMGGEQRVLDGLQQKLIEMNPDVANMTFQELPFCSVEEFDYEAIGHDVAEDGADIVWISLGAPKQEYFMARLQPYLPHGVMIAVGAAFKFFSGVDVKRAPEWMVKHRLEFVYRLASEPKKQFGRCYDILRTLPWLLWSEWRRKQKAAQTAQTTYLS